MDEVDEFIYWACHVSKEFKIARWNNYWCEFHDCRTDEDIKEAFLKWRANK